MWAFLSRVNKILTLRCRESAKLMSRELDEPLGWSDRAAIRMHMLVCGPCRHFKQHLVVLRGVFRNVSRGEAVGSDDAPLTLSNERKQQIRDELTERLKG